MTYPPPLPYGAFLDRLYRDFGVTEKKSSSLLVGPRGEAPLAYLERADRGKVLRLVKPELELDDQVCPELMDYICRRLSLNKADFGFNLN